MEKYNPNKIEQKWQRIWQNAETYKTPDRVKGKKNFYHLVMFPYPSGDLHIGHWYNFAPADVYARFKRLQGFNVMSPIGFDAFGLPAENAAIKHKIHPRTWTYKNIERMRRQLKSIGTIYDWSREIITSEPDYYKWTQWMFLQLYKAGLVLRAKVPANFCPSCKTVLANEQVIDGKCERCGTEVIQKEMEQWLFKITDYAESLLKGLKNLDWPETTKIMQKNWIGKSEGWEIKFEVRSANRQTIFQVPVFTTRTDTLFGCTYLVVAPEHPIIENLKSEITNYKFVKRYIEESKKKDKKQRLSEIKGKTGIEIKGIKAVNPANRKEISIFVADYVLASYATGAIMAVPAHDQRDFDFSRAYNLPVIEVIKPATEKETLPQKVSLVVSDGRFEKSYEGEGTLINSGRFSGMDSSQGRERIGRWLENKRLAKRAIYYRLQDWLVSRQRYWGCPIPMVFCQNCGWQPVKEKDLPVLLPQLQDFKPTGEGKSPLAKAEKFVKTVCPKCKGPARRETDTLDTFVCSSWYYFRYADPKNEKKFASKTKIKKWLPVNIYIGGAEHACLHLLYSRFFTKVLKNLGYINFNEPFLKLRHQGIILGPNGQKMSKSRGNVIDPDQQVKKYGADVVRMYLCFMGPYNQGGPWQARGIIGMSRFLNRVWKLFQKNEKYETGGPKVNSKNRSQELEKLLHRTIKKVTEDVENLKLNTAISALTILVNELSKENIANLNRYLKTLLLLLSPFAPHLTEELWQKHVTKIPDNEFRILNSIHSQNWPKYNKRLVKEEIITLIVQVNGKIRDKIAADADVSKEKAQALAISSKKVQKWIEGKKIKKIIFVPGKLINIVI